MSGLTEDEDYSALQLRDDEMVWHLGGMRELLLWECLVVVQCQLSGASFLSLTQALWTRATQAEMSLRLVCPAFVIDFIHLHTFTSVGTSAATLAQPEPALWKERNQGT